MSGFQLRSADYTNRLTIRADGLTYRARMLSACEPDNPAALRHARRLRRRARLLRDRIDLRKPIAQ